MAGVLQLHRHEVTARVAHLRAERQPDRLIAPERPVGVLSAALWAMLLEGLVPNPMQYSAKKVAGLHDLFEPIGLMTEDTECREDTIKFMGIRTLSGCI